MGMQAKLLRRIAHQVGGGTRPAYMKQEEKHKDFAESIREWAEWNRKGAEEAKLHFMTGWRM